MLLKESGQFENPPAGSHIARCTAIIDLGTQQHSYNNEVWTSRDVKIVWELPLERMTGKYHAESKGKVFQVSITVKQSLHPSAKLRKYLEGWRGKKFEKDDIAGGFDLKKLLGKTCRLTLIENGEYVNVTGISPIGKGEDCPKQINPSLYFSLAPEEFNAQILSSFSPKMQEKIKKSPEYGVLMGDDSPGGFVPSEDGEEDNGEPF